MKLLIIKTSSLGDIVQAREVLQELNGIEVSWVVEEPFKGLLEGQVDHLLVVKTKKWRKNLFSSFKEIKAFIRELRKTRYDKIVDLQGNFKSSLIVAFARGAVKVGFGWRTVPEKLNRLFTNRAVNPLQGQNIRSDYRALFELPEPPPKPPKPPKVISKVMVGMGSAWPNKQLLESSWNELLTLFQARHPEARFYFLWGTEAEKASAERLQRQFKEALLVPKLSLAELEAYMREFDYYIGVDSFPLHLAGSLGLPTYGLFGPSSGLKYGPLGSPFYQGSCPYGQTFEKRCPKLRTCPTGACLKENLDFTKFTKLEDDLGN